MKRALLLLFAAAGVTACRGSLSEPPFAAVPIGGSPDHGAQLIEARHCGACHDIPGIRGANGVVGPPLTKFAFRSYVAGRLPNTPDNLIHWIQDPRGVDAHTAMPVLGLSEPEARDVAAYLYTLR